LIALSNCEPDQFRRDLKTCFAASAVEVFFLTYLHYIKGLLLAYWFAEEKCECLTAQAEIYYGRRCCVCV